MAPTTSTSVATTGSTISQPTTTYSSTSTEVTPTTTDTTTTATMVPTTAPTTKPPFKVPDCNDGHGDINPCRVGPSGAVYYYKCRYFSPVWYDYEIKFCRDIRYDPQCFGKVCF